jgi:hypothetical protein
MAPLFCDSLSLRWGFFGDDPPPGDLLGIGQWNSFGGGPVTMAPPWLNGQSGNGQLGDEQFVGGPITEGGPMTLAPPGSITIMERGHWTSGRCGKFSKVVEWERANCSGTPSRARQGNERSP